MDEQALWERAERLTTFVVQQSLAPAGSGGSDDSAPTDGPLKRFASDCNSPDDYGVSDGKADVDALTNAFPGLSLTTLGEKRMWHLDVLYPLSVATVADSRELSLYTKQKLYPDDMEHLLTAAEVETYPEPDDLDTAEKARCHGIGPAREHTATNIVRRIRHDIEQPRSITRYAGALCCVRWIANLNMHGIGQALPSVVDSIPDTLPGSPLRRGAVTSAFWAADQQPTVPPHEYVSPLLVALNDPNVRISGHATAAMTRLLRTGKRGRGDPEKYRIGADALLDVLSSDDCSPSVARTIMTWIQWRDWDDLSEDVPEAVPENASARTAAAIKSYLDSEDEILRDRAEYIERRRL